MVVIVFPCSHTYRDDGNYTILVFFFLPDIYFLSLSEVDKMFLTSYFCEIPHEALTTLIIISGTPVVGV